MADRPDYQAGERRLHYAAAPGGRPACQTPWGRTDTTRDPDAVDCRKCKITVLWRRDKGLVAWRGGKWVPAHA